MTACQDCQHYEFITDDDDVICSESCNAPLPVWIEAALRRLDCDPEDAYWDSSVAGKSCEAFKEIE